MSLSEKWASSEDFATLFQYFWHRDFPIDQKATGARRVEWTIHIGIVVRNIADLMGLFTRFERGGRKDAVLRSAVGDEIAIEWEWKNTWKEELIKLVKHPVWNNPNSINVDINRPLKYAVLITYTSSEKIKEVYKGVDDLWVNTKWPLLLILIDYERNRIYSSRREFKKIHISIFSNGRRKELRTVQALPWQVSGTRWIAPTS